MLEYMLQSVIFFISSVYELYIDTRCTSIVFVIQLYNEQKKRILFLKLQCASGYTLTSIVASVGVSLF